MVVSQGFSIGSPHAPTPCPLQKKAPPLQLPVLESLLALDALGWGRCGVGMLQFKSSMANTQPVEVGTAGRKSLKFYQGFCYIPAD